MARIRSIKPEFWSDAKVAKLSLPARLLFIALWNFADDYGIGRALPREIGGFAFPHDDEINVKPLLEELEKMEFVQIYTVDDNPYYIISNWTKHQKVDKPGKGLLPKPPETLARVSRKSREYLRKIPPLDLGSRIKDLGKGEGSTNAPLEESEPDPSLEVPSSLEPEIIFDSLEDKTGKPFFIPQGKIDEWKKTFPNLDVESETRRAIQWHRDNPSKRKTSAGMLRFFFSWLSSSNDRPSRPLLPFQEVKPNGQPKPNDPWAAPGPDDNSLRARLLRRDAGMSGLQGNDSASA